MGRHRRTQGRASVHALAAIGGAAVSTVALAVRAGVVVGGEPPLVPQLGAYVCFGEVTNVSNICEVRVEFDEPGVPKLVEHIEDLGFENRNAVRSLASAD